MRIIFTIALLMIFMGKISSAQTEQAFYVAAVVKNGSMISQNSILAGGRTGWIVSNNIFLGAAFYSLINKVETNQIDPLSSRKLLALFNCGGLEIEFIYPSNNIIHGSALFFVGGGGIKPRAADVSVPHSSYNGQSVLIWEPQVNLEADLTRLLHLGLGLSYRIVTGVDGYIGLQNRDLSGLNSLASLRFGIH